MSGILQKAYKLFFSSFDQNALITGTSDIIVVRWNTGQLLSSPFLACFGYKSTLQQSIQINIYINNCLIPSISKYFSINKYGYITPQSPSSQILQKFQLNEGRNTITFQLKDKQKQSANSYQCKIQCEIYLYEQTDKILISDMDGTLTKSDICGLYNNYYNRGYMHDDYHTLVQAAYKNGYKIVWLTMRSLPLYNFSKKYIHKQTKLDGPLLTQPQQFFPAVKKQILHKTCNTKTNMLLTIRSLFPQNINPFIGGLGNRQNDAIAYRAAGIPIQSIFIVNVQSNVQHFGNHDKWISYGAMSLDAERYFPKLEEKLIIKILDKIKQQKNNKKKQNGRGSSLFAKFIK